MLTEALLHISLGRLFIGADTALQTAISSYNITWQVFGRHSKDNLIFYDLNSFPVFCYLFLYTFWIITIVGFKLSYILYQSL